MPWSKLKNIIILLLLLTNFSLLALDLNRSIHASRLQAQARTDAITFLQDRGVQIQESMIPDVMELFPQQVFRDTQQEARLAAALLDGEMQSESRGAGVYRYFNDNGVIQFHSGGEFFAQFTAGRFPVQGDDPTTQEAREILSFIEFQGDLIASELNGSVQSFTFRQRWNGIPLMNCQATVNYENGYLSGISGGRRLFGSPQMNRSVAVMTIPTALMQFYTGMTSELGDACREVTSITQAYVITTSILDPMFMTPVWYITTDTGSQYQLNIISGILSRT